METNQERWEKFERKASEILRPYGLQPKLSEFILKFIGTLPGAEGDVVFSPNTIFSEARMFDDAPGMLIVGIRNNATQLGEFCNRFNFGYGPNAVDVREMEESILLTFNFSEVLNNADKDMIKSFADFFKKYAAKNPAEIEKYQKASGVRTYTTAQMERGVKKLREQLRWLENELKVSPDAQLIEACIIATGFRDQVKKREPINRTRVKLFEELVDNLNDAMISWQPGKDKSSMSQEEKDERRLKAAHHVMAAREILLNKDIYSSHGPIDRVFPLYAMLENVYVSLKLKRTSRNAVVERMKAQIDKLHELTKSPSATEATPTTCDLCSDIRYAVKEYEKTLDPREAFLLAGTKRRLLNFCSELCLGIDQRPTPKDFRAHMAEVRTRS